MPNEQLVRYFRQYIGQYPVAQLKQQLVQQGFAAAEVEEAANTAQQPPPIAPPVMQATQHFLSKKSAPREGTITGAIVGGIGMLIEVLLSFLPFLGVSGTGLIGQGFAAIIMIPLGIIFGGLFGALLGWLIVQFQEKLPGNGLFMKSFILLLIIHAIFTLIGIGGLFFNPLRFLVGIVLGVAVAYAWATMFTKRMEG